MSQVPIWFERKFEFSFPVELLPNLRARLRGTPARLEEALRGRSHEILIGRAQGKWSAQEHGGHLLDLEPLWLTRMGDYVAASDQLTVADQALVFNPTMRALAAEETLVPLTARFHIGYGYEGLGTHEDILRLTGVGHFSSRVLSVFKSLAISVGHGHASKL